MKLSNAYFAGASANQRETRFLPFFFWAIASVVIIEFASIALPQLASGLGECWLATLSGADAWADKYVTLRRVS